MRIEIELTDKDELEAENGPGAAHGFEFHARLRINGVLTALHSSCALQACVDSIETDLQYHLEQMDPGKDL